MLRSILAASDLSSRSAPAIRRAVGLAKGMGASLTILHVVEDDQPEARRIEEMRSAEAFLTEEVEAFGRPEACEILVRAGDAFQVIGEEAHARGADLIVLGAHRRQFLRDVFIGTTVERVTRLARLPVLMANGPAENRWTDVFIATDMSETSARAARRARDLGILAGANITFVHAFVPVVRPMMSYAAIPEERVQEEEIREFEAVRRDVLGFVHDLGFENPRYGVRIVEGLGASAIAGLVDHARPDLLVIGTRGLSGVKRVFLGSVASELMSRLTTDILAVPPEE